MRGSLKAVDLGDRPKYETLSYTWGRFEGNASIRLHDVCDLRVTDHLLCALRRLRKRWTVRTILVDAICINQMDNEEKSQQVSIMGDVYSRGECVNIWFGEYEGCTNLERCMAVFARFFIESIRDIAYTRSKYLHPLPRVLTRAYLRKAKSKVISPLGSILAQQVPQWHTRVWTVQEYVLSQKSYACFGPIRIELRGSIDYRLLYYGVIPADSKYTSCQRQIRELAYHLKALNRATEDVQEGALTIMSSLERFRGTLATDLRDHVYSLIGLLNSDEAILIPPDYGSSCAEVFARAMYASLRVGKNQRTDRLVILAFVGLNQVERQAKVEGLPSWAVDFSTPPKMIYGDFDLERRGTPLCLEGKISLEFQVDLIKSSESSLQLVTRGVILGSVSGIWSYSPRDLRHDFDEDSDDGSSAVILSLLNFIYNAVQVAISDGDLPSSLSAGLKRKKVEVESTIVNPLLLHSLAHDSSGILTWVLDSWQYLAGLHSTFEDLTKERYRSYLTDYLESYLGYQTDGNLHVVATSRGFVGVGPATMTPGDVIALLPGSGWPVILSPRGEQWVFRGLIWVQGLMEGETWPETNNWNFEERELRLI